MGTSFRPNQSKIKAVPARAKNPDQEIIVNGLRYYIGPYSKTHHSNHLKGFGGRPYTIRFHNGEIFEIDDLWWDYSHKNHSKPDTAIILQGWGSPLPVCEWQSAGDGQQVFGPIHPHRRGK